MGWLLETGQKVVYTSNLILAFAGFGLLALGICIARSKGSIFDIMLKGQISTTGIILAVFGGSLFAFALLGWCGVHFKIHFAIQLYAILMGTLLLLQMAVAVSAYMTRGVAEDATTQVIEDQYLQLKIDSNIGEIIDRLQTHFQCCGSTNNTTPWKTNYIKTPTSCYPKGNSSAHIFKEGCVIAINRVIGKVIYYCALPVIAAISIVQVIGVVFSLFLNKSI